MLTTGIDFKNFKKKTNISIINKKLKLIINEKNQVLHSLSKKYKNSFHRKVLKKYRSSLNYRVIGMGGSILGTQAIYQFLKYKIKKNFIFIDNLQNKEIKNQKKKLVNLIISKSGNTTETIINSNIIIKKKDRNIFITENKKNYLYLFAEKLKAEIIHHNNFIGGRYSVLSEVGMLPAELMGLKSKSFKQFNALIKNKVFLNSLVKNVGSILYLNKKKKI
mgnify:CR=1 FL=1